MKKEILDSWAEVYREQTSRYVKLASEQLQLLEAGNLHSGNREETPYGTREVLDRHLEILSQRVKLVREKREHLRWGMKALDRDNY